MDILNISLVSRNLYSSITEVLLVFLASILSGVSIYLYFKDRNKNYPPGPIGIPILGYLPFLGTEPHKTLMKLKEKYGNVIGLYLGRKYTIILNDWTAVKEILCHSNALDRSPRVFNNISSLGFGSENGKIWMEQRRFCVATLRDLGIGRGPWETIIVEEVQCFIKELQQFDGKAIDITYALISSIASNILTFLIGHTLHKEKEPEKIQLPSDFVHSFATHSGPSTITFLFPWLREYFKMFKITEYDKALKNINNFCQFVKDEIAQHKTSAEFKDVHDFINAYLGKLSELTSLNETQHSFSESLLVGNICLLFLGAADTIFSILGWIFSFMAQHPGVQQKVYNELMTVFGTDRIARYEERHAIPYTFAVLMESQRVASILPLNVTRCASKDFSVRGYTIPKGAEIVANFWALHNDPQYWDEPEKFKPERFLRDKGRVLVTSPESYAPFSIGRRSCPGETFGWMEVLFYFTEIIKKFEIQTEDGKKPEFCRTSGLVQHLKPQLLCFKEREKH